MQGRKLGRFTFCAFLIAVGACRIIFNGLSHFWNSQCVHMNKKKVALALMIYTKWNVLQLYLKKIMQICEIKIIHKSVEFKD